jgi:hypothetical protein
LKIRLEDRLPFVTVKLGRGTEELVLPLGPLGPSGR